MKKVALILALIAVVNVSKADSPVSILAIKSSIIYLKVNKDLIGATLKVEDESGNALVTEKILHKKVIVDFYYKKAGKYRVTIVLNDREETFTYENVAFESANTEAETDEIIVSQ